MRYEQAKMFDEVIEVAEKKEGNMVKVIQFLIEPEPRKHLEVNFCMESAMEQMINQMN